MMESRLPSRFTPFGPWSSTRVTKRVKTNPVCTAPKPPLQLTVGGYLELHGADADWRLRVSDGNLVMEKKISGVWMTRSRMN